MRTGDANWLKNVAILDKMVRESELEVSVQSFVVLIRMRFSRTEFQAVFIAILLPLRDTLSKL